MTMMPAMMTMSGFDDDHFVKGHERLNDRHAGPYN
jgi:hypothetical protein